MPDSVPPPVREPDAREEADWFQRLPEHAKEEYRARWNDSDGLDSQRVERRKASQARYVIEAFALFVLLEFAFFGIHVTRLFTLAVPGLALGWIAHRVRANIWKYVAVAIPIYLVVYGTLGVLMIGHFIVFVCLAATLGFTHEMLRADGTEG
jgi:hypothetical protein